MALAVTALVSVLPAVLATALLPSTDLLSILGSMVLAVALSMVAARLCAMAWARHSGSRAVLFADLMAWSWLYRRVTEWRLEATRRRVRDASVAGDAIPMPTLVRLGRLLGARDIYTYGHSRRVARHAQNIARELRLEPAEVQRIGRAAAVHDIGKLHTPQAIIAKPGRLTDAEFAIVKRHPVDGAEMLADAGDPELVAMVRHHHERLDGRGYPDGLSGQDIPLGARIIAVADTFDALTSTRSYRPAQTHKQALAVLSAEAGTQLDEHAVAAFLRHYGAGRPAAAGAALTTAAQRLLSWMGSGAAGVSSGAASLAQVVPATGALAAVALFPAVHAAGGPVPRSEAPTTTRATTATTSTTLGAPRSGPAPRTKRRAAARRQADKTRNAPRRRDRPATSPSPGGGGVAGTRDEGHAPTAMPQATTTASAAVPPTPAGAPAATTTPVTTSTTVSTPAATTTTVTTPAVKVPAVTTPAVTTPVATVPAVTTPAVTTQEATVPSAKVPPVQAPALTLPSATAPAHGGAPHSP